ncbi:hypothetical protein TWF281_003394 [Arthrobotrys megalospora]
MQPATTLSTLPSDIVYEICDYLPNQDLLNLQLVSKALSSKIPGSRLERIFSKIFFSFTDTDTRKLKRLASTNAKHLARVKHLVFELSNPHRLLDQYAEFSCNIIDHETSTKIKVLQFCHNYEARKARSRTKRFLKNSAKRLFPTSDDNGALYEPVDTYPLIYSEPGAEPTLVEEGLRWDAFRPFFNIIEANVQNVPRSTRFGFDRQAFFKALTDAFKLLPNLQILEFTHMSTEHKSVEVREEFSRYWRKYNPAIEAFLAKTPDVRELPWWDCFEVVGYTINCVEAYPAVLFCAALAQCRISEIRANRIMYGSMDYVSTSPYDFDTFGNKTVHIPDSVRTMSQYEATYLDGYKHTFGNLTRLETVLYGDNPNTAVQEKKFSPFFLAIVKNARELVIRKPPRSGLRFMIPTSLVLPNLRRLEVIKAYIAIEPLVNFVQTNKDSLRELVCSLTFEECTTKDTMIKFLRDMRNILDLEVCKIDCLTNREPEMSCYLSVDIKGNWRNDNICKYRIGSKCTAGRCWLVPDPLIGTYWVEKQSWEEFAVGIEEMGTLKYCSDHWKAEYKMYSRD